MHFSSRVDISAPNPIAAAEAAAKANGIALSKLNDSNPTRHGLAPELVPSVYTADPRGPRAAREALAAFLNTAKAVDASSPQSTSPAASEGGNERHAAFNNANTAIEGVDPDAEGDDVFLPDGKARRQLVSAVRLQQVGTALQQIQAPTLLLSGSRDPVIHPWTLEVIRHQVRGAVIR